MLLDLKPTTSIVDAIRERDRLDRDAPSPPDAQARQRTAPAGRAGRMRSRASKWTTRRSRGSLNMARRSFKYVIVDTFPMLDSVLMTTLDVTDVAFIVVQGLAPAVAGIARLLPVLGGTRPSRRAAAPGPELQLQAVSRKPAALGHRQPAAAHARLRRAVRGPRPAVDEHRQSAHPAHAAMGALRTDHQPSRRRSRRLDRSTRPARRGARRSVPIGAASERPIRRRCCDDRSSRRSRRRLQRCGGAAEGALPRGPAGRRPRTATRRAKPAKPGTIATTWR